jgi:hypothetical protein
VQKATVSGSFHRHMQAIYKAVGTLREAGVDVLSPSDPRVVDHIGDFLFVASDKLRSIKLVQDRHLHAIRASNFLWVVCPDGYTGPSVSMEIGAAYACGVPVFSASPPVDVTLKAYVTCLPTIQHAVSAVGGSRHNSKPASHILLNPAVGIEGMHETLDGLTPYLVGRAGDGRGDAENKLAEAARSIRNRLVGVGV